MNYSRMNKDEFLSQCVLRIKNSLEDQRIIVEVEKFGYNAEKMREGEALLNQAVELNRLFLKEHGDVEEAYKQRDEMRKKAHTTYMQFVAIGRVAFKNTTNALATLQLNGRRAYAFGPWVAQVSNFYSNLQKNQAWLDAMAAFGMSNKKIATGVQQLSELEQFEQAISKEKGDAQEATEKRDAKFEELAEWVNDYEVIVKVAFADNPQLMEKLGIVVK